MLAIESPVWYKPDLSVGASTSTEPVGEARPGSPPDGQQQARAVLLLLHPALHPVHTVPGWGHV